MMVDIAVFGIGRGFGNVSGDATVVESGPEPEPEIEKQRAVGVGIVRETSNLVRDGCL